VWGEAELWPGVSGEGRAGLSCTEQPVLMGLKKMVPGRKRDQPQGFWEQGGDIPWRGSWGCCMVLLVGAVGQFHELVMGRGGADPNGLGTRARSRTLLFTAWGAAQPLLTSLSPPSAQRR